MKIRVGIYEDAESELARFRTRIHKGVALHEKLQPLPVVPPGFIQSTPSVGEPAQLRTRLKRWRKYRQWKA